MNKLLVVTGPTSVGKTALAVKLAKEFNGELISADSRQVYKGMDIATGKDKDSFESVKIWGLDLVDPDHAFNLSEFLKFAEESTADIYSRGKLPILVGGTAHYIKSFLFPPETAHLPPNDKLRKELETLTVEQLQERLQNEDEDKWESMNDSDRSNPRRLVRALEIVGLPTEKSDSSYDFFIVALNAPLEKIKSNIEHRVEKRLEQGILEERKTIKEKNYSSKLPSQSAHGYKDQPIEDWVTEEFQYAKRQLTFLKKMPVTWFDVSQSGWQENVWSEVTKWYSDRDGQG